MTNGPYFNSMRARHERVYGPVSDEAFMAWVQANIDELEENWGPERAREGGFEKGRCDYRPPRW